MCRRKKNKCVVIEGTVSQVDWDDEWDAKGVIIVTPVSDLYQEFYVEPDEVGRELNEHLYEFVRVYGKLRRSGSNRKVVQALEFQVLRFGLEGDEVWDIDLEAGAWDIDTEYDSYDDEFFQQSIRNGSLGN